MRSLEVLGNAGEQNTKSKKAGFIKSPNYNVA